MKKIVIAVVAAVLSAAGIAFAAPSAADCGGGGNGGWTPWGGGSYCDGDPYPDGSYDHCVSVTVLGFGGTNCQQIYPPAPPP
ncbi:hypothetical protein MI149_27785 [Mycolicibacterium crocinum]|uniref:Uncharacterized protein n=1 Tax=Mycolicibacterium crocinum TaxID=388459 RepID=A0ABY3TN58_9MYCO|nr:hypothetical protein [Mycolicibacterium crocinum]ULN41339.1 hypothetical protein MI149_27785 [Mycolicibacterium crocinum]